MGNVMSKYFWAVVGVGMMVAAASCQSLDQQVMDVLQAAVNNGTLTEAEATKFAGVWLDFSSRVAEDWVGYVGGLLGAAITAMTGGTLIANRQIKKAVANASNGGITPTK